MVVHGSENVPFLAHFVASVAIEGPPKHSGNHYSATIGSTIIAARVTA